MAQNNINAKAKLLEFPVDIGICEFKRMKIMFLSFATCTYISITFGLNFLVKTNKFFILASPSIYNISRSYLYVE